jgi:hypothetical protein
MCRVLLAALLVFVLFAVAMCDSPLKQLVEKVKASASDSSRPPHPTGSRPPKPTGDYSRPPRPTGDHSRPPRPTGSRPPRPTGQAN